MIICAYRSMLQFLDWSFQTQISSCHFLAYTSSWLLEYISEHDMENTSWSGNFGPSQPQISSFSVPLSCIFSSPTRATQDFGSLNGPCMCSLTSVLFQHAAVSSSYSVLPLFYLNNSCLFSRLSSDKTSLRKLSWHCPSSPKSLGKESSLCFCSTYHYDRTYHSVV